MSHVTAVVEVYTSLLVSKQGVLLNIVAGEAPSLKGSAFGVGRRHRLPTMPRALLDSCLEQMRLNLKIRQKIRIPAYNTISNL